MALGMLNSLRACLPFLRPSRPSAGGPTLSSRSIETGQPTTSRAQHARPSSPASLRYRVVSALSSGIYRFSGKRIIGVERLGIPKGLTFEELLQTGADLKGVKLERLRDLGVQLADPQAGALLNANALLDAGVELAKETPEGLREKGISLYDTTLQRVVDAKIDLRGNTLEMLQGDHGDHLLWQPDGLLTGCKGFAQAGLDRLLEAGVSLQGERPRLLRKRGFDPDAVDRARLEQAGMQPDWETLEQLKARHAGSLQNVKLSELIEQGIGLEEVNFQQLLDEGLLLKGTRLPDLLTTGIDLSGLEFQDLVNAGVEPADVPLWQLMEAGVHVGGRFDTLRNRGIDPGGMSFSDLLASKVVDVAGTLFNCLEGDIDLDHTTFLDLRKAGVIFERNELVNMQHEISFRGARPADLLQAGLNVSNVHVKDLCKILQMPLPDPSVEEPLEAYKLTGLFERGLRLDGCTGEDVKAMGFSLENTNPDILQRAGFKRA
jgi:hypothetical protein